MVFSGCIMVWCCRLCHRRFLSVDREISADQLLFHKFDPFDILSLWSLIQNTVWDWLCKNLCKLKLLYRPTCPICFLPRSREQDYNYFWPNQCWKCSSADFDFFFISDPILMGFLLNDSLWKKQQKSLQYSFITFTFFKIKGSQRGKICHINFLFSSDFDRILFYSICLFGVNRFSLSLTVFKINSAKGTNKHAFCRFWNF